MSERAKSSGAAAAISRIGFGCARIYGGSETRRSTRLIEAALNAGIRHFDTAPMYGGGRAEEVLGQVLSGIPDVTVATKVGIGRPPPNSERPIKIAYRRFVHPMLTDMPSVKARLRKLQTELWHSGSGTAKVQRSLSGAEIRRELTESLLRLKRDRVALYLVHEPDQFTLDDEALETFTALKREGIVDAFGLAYGRVVDSAPNFGTVVQSRYSHVPSRNACNEDRRRKIFHGVLRQGSSSEAHMKSGISPGERIANALTTHPEAALLFSASSVAQIAQATAALK